MAIRSKRSRVFLNSCQLSSVRFLISPSLRILKLPMITESLRRAGRPYLAADVLNSALIFCQSVEVKCCAIANSF